MTFLFNNMHVCKRMNSNIIIILIKLSFLIKLSTWQIPNYKIFFLYQVSLYWKLMGGGEGGRGRTVCIILFWRRIVREAMDWGRTVMAKNWFGREQSVIRTVKPWKLFFLQCSSVCQLRVLRIDVTLLLYE